MICLAGSKFKVKDQGHQVQNCKNSVFSLVSEKMVKGQGHKGQGRKCIISIVNLLSKAKVKVKFPKGQCHLVKVKFVGNPIDLRRVRYDLT